MTIQLRNKISNGRCVGNEWVVLCDGGRKFLFKTKRAALAFVADHKEGLPLRTTINDELYEREHDLQVWTKVDAKELTLRLLAAGYRIKWAVLDEKIKAVRAMIEQAKAENWQHVSISVVSALVGTPEQPIHQSEWRDDDLWHCINGEWISETDLKRWCANNMDSDRYVDVVRQCHLVAYAGRPR